jgi:5-methylcytosine-specific restriction enzyme subunit McrC
MTSSIELQEWSQKTPSEHASPLAGASLEDAEARTLAQQLTVARMLEIRELRDGLSISSTSYVGRIALGDFVITVQPKISGMPLVRLLHYAYGLRDLRLASLLGYTQEQWAFQEILIAQLVEEASELMARGLHRRYRRTDEDLACPRGRIDLQRIAQRGGVIEATIPCTYYPRLEDCLVNQVLLQGLYLAAHLTGESKLRVYLFRLVSLLEESVSSIRLDAHTLKRLHREMDRLTSAYRPAITIIELLLAGEGISLVDDRQRMRLPGFLFDMNRFFQALLTRFLKEQLTEYDVRDQYQIKGMMTYDPAYNPRRQRAPMPRPDYVVVQHGQVVSILDAKYRDLWEHDLPAHWLYQVAIYALSRQQEKIAVILYPTTDGEAQEARIVLAEPVFGAGQAMVVLRPVDLLRLEQLITGAMTARNERERRAFAEWLAFGEV